jgi:hypothetical protein
MNVFITFISEHKFNEEFTKSVNIKEKLNQGVFIGNRFSQEKSKTELTMLKLNQKKIPLMGKSATYLFI